MPKAQKLPAGRGIRNKKPWTVKEVEEISVSTVAETPEDGEELRESGNFSSYPIV